MFGEAEGASGQDEPTLKTSAYKTPMGKRDKVVTNTEEGKSAHKTPKGKRGKVDTNTEEGKSDHKTPKGKRRKVDINTEEGKSEASKAEEMIAPTEQRELKDPTTNAEQDEPKALAILDVMGAANEEVQAATDTAQADVRLHLETLAQPVKSAVADSHPVTDTEPPTINTQQDGPENNEQESALAIVLSPLPYKRLEIPNIPYCARCKQMVDPTGKGVRICKKKTRVHASAALATRDRPH